MKTILPAKSIQGLCLASVLLMQAASVLAQGQITTEHLYAGAAGTAYGDPLIWANGSAFSSDAGYYAMPLGSPGIHAGYFIGGPTIAVLAATAANGGPAPFAPALGSFIQVQLTLISAPDGAKFNFWEAAATTPTYTLNVGETTPTIRLTESDGAFGTDPFGHIEERYFGGTLKGDYIVGLQLIDTTDNGLDGLPIHTPSDTLQMDFRAVQAVPEPGTLALVALGVAGLYLPRARRAPRSRA